VGHLLHNGHDLASVVFISRPAITHPGVIVILIARSASFLGDGLRDALDPRQRVEK